MSDHLQTLRERERYLRARVIAKQSVGWEYAYDERERAALEWAIGQIDRSRQNDPDASA